jgi:hypothetical protein
VRVLTSGYALSASVVLALFCGCSSGSQRAAVGLKVPDAPRPPQATSIASRVGLQATAHPISGPGYYEATSARAAHVFVSDATGNVVDIFTGTRQTGQITGFDEPQGITTDRSGILYVANTEAGNVEEFAPPYGHTPVAVIADDSGFPAAVAISSKGLLAVFNICSGPSCSLAGNVAFYTKGSLALPCNVVSGGVAATPLGGGFDDEGTLFIGALNSGRVATISEIRGGCKAKSIIALTTPNTIVFPGDVQVDRKANVVVLDSQAIGAAQLDVYAPPGKHAKALTLISTSSLLNAAAPLGFALTANDADFYTADAGAHQAQEYPYPAAGSSILQLNPNPPGLFEGVAVTPVVFP